MQIQENNYATFWNSVTYIYYKRNKIHLVRCLILFSLYCNSHQQWFSFKLLCTFASQNMHSEKKKTVNYISKSGIFKICHLNIEYFDKIVSLSFLLLSSHDTTTSTDDCSIIKGSI